MKTTDAQEYKMCTARIGSENLPLEVKLKICKFSYITQLAEPYGVGQLKKVEFTNLLTATKSAEFRSNTKSAAWELHSLHL